MARILPYPPPGKWPAGKTNHLPNIQRFSPAVTPQFGPVARLTWVNPESKALLKERRHIHPLRGRKTGVSREKSRRYRGFGFDRGNVGLRRYSAASDSNDFGSEADAWKSQMRGTISDLKREPLNTP